LEWADSPSGREFALIGRAIRDLPAPALGYSLKDAWAALGLDLEDSENHAAWNAAKRYWAPRFFSNDYIDHDVAYPGAVEFVQHLAQAGIQIRYLTGRDEPNMAPGTRQKLLKDGFPLGTDPLDPVPSKKVLWMKPSRELDDHAFKTEAVLEIAKQGSLIASFENEPKNLVALREILPQAMHVFLHTVCSDHPAPAVSSLYRMRHFVRK
jgi:hypothetical protein